MNRRLLTGLAAAVAAVIGLVLVISYANGADARAQADLEPTSVLVVTTAVPAGTPVENLAASVESRSLPKASVASSAVAALADHPGTVTGAALVPGETLLKERLVAPSALAAAGSIPVPQGLQEVTFSVAPVRVVGGKVAAGDTVGFFATFAKGVPDGDKVDTSMTQRVHHKLLVTSVQRAPAAAASAAPPSDGAAGAAATSEALPEGPEMFVTVAVDDAAAQKIIFAAEFGSIWLTKERKDAKEADPARTTIEELYP